MNDIGIVIEIIGFFLFLITPKELPPQSLRLATNVFDYGIKMRKRWSWSFLELGYHKGYALRIVAIALIIIGLVLQFEFLQSP